MKTTPREIVLVDDEDLTRVRLERTFRKTGWTIRYFSDNREALQHLSEHAPPLILIDQQMPRIDGDELLEQLRELPHLDDAVLAICSSVKPPARVVTRVIALGGEIISKDCLANLDEITAYLPDLDAQA